jgi:hypothetical protein
MWGGTRGAILKATGKTMLTLAQDFKQGGYSSDLTFLTSQVWPKIKKDQISHDSYSCLAWPNAYSLPDRRSDAYEHVGQVFINGKPRMNDIDGYIRNKPNSKMCRRHPENTWG